MSSFRSWNTMYFSLLGSPLPLLCSMGSFPSLVEGWSTSFFSIRFPSISWTSCSRDTGSLFHHGGKARERFSWSQRPVGWKRYLIFCIHLASIMGNWSVSPSWMIRISPIRVYGWCSRIKWWTLWPRKWWMKCLLICQVRTTILVTWSRSLRVWGSMYRLISMPLTSLPWVINGFEKSGD